MKQRDRPTGKPRFASGGPPSPANFERPVGGRKKLRAAIAHSAARLVAEGLSDYLLAKQKAARQLGVTDISALPDNHEIELALREHLALFAFETQPDILSALRETAVRVMSWLEPYSPWLTGAVLSGTANEFSEIELELVGIVPKEFEMFLLNNSVSFEICDARHTRGVSPVKRRPEITYRLQFDGAPVLLALYEHHGDRQSANPDRSIRHERVQRADAIQRFQEEDGKSESGSFM